MILLGFKKFVIDIELDPENLGKNTMVIIKIHKLTTMNFAIVIHQVPECALAVVTHPEVNHRNTISHRCCLIWQPKLVHRH